MSKSDPERVIPECFSRGPRTWILFFFCAANTLVSFNVSALTAVIPAISRSLNVSANDASGIIAFYMIPYGLCALLYTPLTTRFSVKSLMVVTAALYAFSNWMCLWSDSLPVILAGRVLAGVAAASSTPLALLTLGKIFEKEVRGRVLGLFFSCSFFGSMLGLTLSAFAPWHWLFVVPLWAAIALTIALLFCPKEGMEANRSLKFDYREALRMPGLRRILIFICVMSFLFNGVCKWYGVYLEKLYNYDQMTISFVIILTALASTIGQNIGGHITDKWGRSAACKIGIAILGVFIMALLGHYPMAVIAAILFMISIGWTIAHNGISTVLTDFSDRYRAELAGLNSTARFLSGGMGFYVSGSFVQANFGRSFFIIGALMLSQILFVKKIVPSGGK